MARDGSDGYCVVLRLVRDMELGCSVTVMKEFTVTPQAYKLIFSSISARCQSAFVSEGVSA